MMIAMFVCLSVYFAMDFMCFPKSNPRVRRRKSGEFRFRARVATDPLDEILI